MGKKYVTLSKLLHLRKTYSEEAATAHKRALDSAIRTNDEPQDFNCNEQSQAFFGAQTNLRKIKTASMDLSIRKTVCVPEFDTNLYPEAGMRVPLYQAVLIRDDAKNARMFIQALLHRQETSFFEEIGYGERMKVVQVIKKRTYDFQQTLMLSASLQDFIDELDGIIQGTDAVVKAEIEL